MDYREAGVNIEEGYRAVERYRELAASTGAALNGIGSFAGMFSLKAPLKAALEAGGMDEPVLVSGTDGVGTKLDIVFRVKKYDTVGIDCVAMCVNDVLCHGARPLFFLDYLACGKLDADVAAALVKGVAAGCRETGAVLLGGETAEMPGFYDEGKYDIAGFAVGIVDRKRIVDGGAVRAGDALLGLASSGPHSNGYSLIRRVIPDLDEDFGGMPIWRALLEPTRLYVKPVLALAGRVAIHGMAHITGGGFYENVPRMFGGRAFDAVIDDPLLPGRDVAWQIPPIFGRIAAGAAGLNVRGAEAQRAGMEALRRDTALRKKMFNTYNMGVGFVIAVPDADAGQAAAFLEERGFPCWKIGRVEARTGGAGEVRFV